MSADLIIKELPDLNLVRLADELDKVAPKSVQTRNQDMRVNVRAGEIQVAPTVSVPFTGDTIRAFASWLDIPSKFLERADPEAQQFLLEHYLNRRPGDATVMYRDDTGIEIIREPGIKYIDPRRLVEIASRVIDTNAQVVEFWNTPDEFRLDVITPENFDRGIGGDRKVGDLTRGGIRIGQNVKMNHAPWVSEFLFRLACTNGMEIRDESSKVDARGATVEEVLAEFEIIADRAFRRVEDSIASFYELREQRVDNPERVINRIGHEQHISPRMRQRLVEIAPVIEPTMFDIINLITNQANDPSLKPGPRRSLQLAGGNIVTEHAARCSHCQARLN